MEKNIVKDKSFQFSLDIIALYKYLPEQKKEFVLSKQKIQLVQLACLHPVHVVSGKFVV